MNGRLSAQNTYCFLIADPRSAALILFSLVMLRLRIGVASFNAYFICFSKTTYDVFWR